MDKMDMWGTSSPNVSGNEVSLMREHFLRLQRFFQAPTVKYYA